MADDVLAGKYGRRTEESGGAMVAYIEALGVVGSSHYAIRALDPSGQILTLATSIISIEDLATYTFFDSFDEANPDTSYDPDALADEDGFDA
ncbi:hypothetical protein [Methylobacterium soli]|uniref:Uncharacterized protein n=1 Tax=Methylobacterium soli TaxID=553447 RepID=A0A6L3SP37_9HYPH|nr:hypothetical protein [Methylobacterium soli]KAB1070605.1 hypothetical protein F6X53_29925 [Methylobacterium soli]GJE41964.1 hypothetical protein AEGHOMDF_1134 [Methylobacterium soli]